jgi:hypothetical protein
MSVFKFTCRNIVDNDTCPPTAYGAARPPPRSLVGMHCKLKKISNATGNNQQRNFTDVILIHVKYFGNLNFMSRCKIRKKYNLWLR